MFVKRKFSLAGAVRSMMTVMIKTKSKFGYSSPFP